ncbi:MAG: hypothetical protein F6K24_06825 [Okeania sp. SIO2D1]|nr:hypothetical protein [Okeania sp. SIO2C9]NEQ72782.1 hypothetical protein [Okeania sp. SIO2C9]NES64981.1 hypothetical protein [Okeania sp. SIO2D1]
MRYRLTQPTTTTCMGVESLQEAIRSLGRSDRQRDTLYLSQKSEVKS